MRFGENDVRTHFLGLMPKSDLKSSVSALNKALSGKGFKLQATESTSYQKHNSIDYRALPRSIQNVPEEGQENRQVTHGQEQCD